MPDDEETNINPHLTDIKPQMTQVQDEYEVTAQAEINDGDVPQLIERYSALFDNMTAERHRLGQQRYGDFTFLENDVIRMMMEELADVSNYARYMFVKLGILNEYLTKQLEGTELADKDNNITIGVKSFKGTKEGWDS